jgi:hypothetical protein
VKRALVVCLALAAPAVAHEAAAAEEAAAAPPIWITGADGVRYRVRFDPGQRLVVGAGAYSTAAGTAPALELGLRLRSQPPAPGWNVYWKRDHELVQLRLAPARIDGALYRGLFLRKSREGTLTLPLSPPVALPLPFDVGLRTELGQLEGPLAIPGPGAPRLRAGVVHGEVLADFWRSPQHGRWLAAGVGARYDVGLGRDAAGALAPDHLVTPMTALSLAVHGEQQDGLLAGGLRAEGAYRWSIVRGWEQTFRAEAEGEATLLAINDRPVSLYAAGVVERAGGLPAPEVRFFVGVRVSEPLR